MESRLTAILCELIHEYTIFETAIDLSQDFLRKLRLLDSGEVEKPLVARTFEKSQKCERKLRDLRKNSETEVSLRKS